MSMVDGGLSGTISKKPGGRRTVKFPHDLGVDIDGGVDVRRRGAIPVFV